MNWVYIWYQLIIIVIYTCHSIEMKQAGINLLFPLVLRICNVTYKYKYPENSKSVYLVPFPRRSKLITRTVRISFFITRWWSTEPPNKLHCRNLSAYSTIFDQIGSHNCRLGLRAFGESLVEKYPWRVSCRELCKQVFMYTPSCFHEHIPTILYWS